MATSVTQSLFGITPQSIQNERDAALQQQAIQFAKLDPFQAARMGLFQGAAQLGSGIVGALGDPEIEQARQRQGMLGGLDLNDPDALMAAAQNIQGSDPQAALALLSQANAAKKDLSTVNKNKYDMEQDQAQYAMRFSALKARDPKISDEEARGIASDADIFKEKIKDPAAKFVTETVDNQVKLYKVTTDGYEFVKSLGAKGKSDVGELAGAVGQLAAGMAKGQATKAAEAGGTAVGKDVAAIQGKEDALTSLKKASKLLKDEKGNYQIYSGFYGPGVTTAVKATGGFAGNRQKVVQTERFLNEVKTTVIPLLAEFGGNDSNEELKFLQGIVGGDQTLEPESIDAILTSAQEKIDRGIKRTQAQQKAILEGQPLPTGPSAQPKPTKRYNPATGRVEVIKE